MVTLYSTSAYAQTPTLWPADNSTTVLQPGSQTITLTFPAANPIWRLRAGGIVSLNSANFGGGGTFQQETLQYGVNSGIVLEGTNKVKITFQHQFVEDAYYYVTVSNDLIQFVGGAYFAGLSVGANPTQWFHPDWSFRVDDIHNPTLATCSTSTVGDNYIFNGQYGVPTSEDTVYICFNEPVAWNPLANPTANGAITFYHATNEDLRLPAGEFGGDVLYQSPYTVTLINPAAAGAPEGISNPGEFNGYNTMKIIVKNLGSNNHETVPNKYAAIGDSVWPKDADIYLRMIAGLVVDKAGNPFMGIGGSPWVNNVATGQYWFSTRDNKVITPSMFAADDNTQVNNGKGAAGNELWSTNDFVIALNEVGLVLADNLTKAFSTWTTADITPFIRITRTGGIPVTYTLDGKWTDATNSYLRLEPGTLVDGQTYTVTIDAGKIADADLALNTAKTVNFLSGDYTAPNMTLDLYNTLCTNFDVRVLTNENTWVYYAVIHQDTLDKSGVAGWWDAPTYLDIIRGYNEFTVNTGTPSQYTRRVYFTHVEDPDGTTPVIGYDYSSQAFLADSFMAQPLLAAYEHIDDFIAQNHGKTMKVFYFGVDKNAEGPYASGVLAASIVGQATAVNNITVTLDDCLAPEQRWHSEGTANEAPDNPLFDYCGQGENIRKQGRWLLKTPTATPALTNEAMILTNPTKTWAQVIHLYVGSTSTGPWTEVEILSAVPNSGATEVMVTPKNSYPSGWYARIVLESGAVEDASGNVINYELSCVKQVETYLDPAITRFTVQTKSSPLCTEGVANTNGVAALRRGAITLKFNNKMYTPKRDELVLNTLRPLSANPSDVNWVGNYIKIRQGNASDASIGSDIWPNMPSFAMYPAVGGGIDSIVVTPPVDYASETWYYVEVDTLLQDENRVELYTYHNNVFTDPHNVSTPNTSNYYIKFKTEDIINPTLSWLFNVVVANDPDVNQPYTAAGVSDSPTNVSPWGQWQTSAYNGVPVAARISEWSKMGFDGQEGYDPDDANSLRQYFSMTTSTGTPLLFDMVVLDSAEPADGDYVVFGFIPFTPLAQGTQYNMTFDPQYAAEGVDYEGHAWAEGPVFIDCNGNPVLQDMNVTFTTWMDNMPVCLNLTAAIVGDTMPNVVLTVTNMLPTTNIDTTPLAEVGAYWLRISDGSQTFDVNDAVGTDFIIVGNTITIPWAMFEKTSGGGSNNALLSLTPYTLTVAADAFLDRNSYNDTLRSCVLTKNFTTADVTAPYITALTPDEINPLAPAGDGANHNTPVPNVRNSTALAITFSENVNAVAGKFVELWENGTTRRDTFYIQEAVKTSGKVFTWTIPGDFLRCNSRYHVDVQAGLVIDATGLGNASMTGSMANSDTTWTFATDMTDVDLAVTGVTPTGVIDPYSVAGYELNAAQDSVKITKFSVILNQKANPVAGKLIAIENTSSTRADLLKVDAALLTSTNGTTWTYTIPGGLWVPYNDDVRIDVPAGAFIETGGCGALETNPEGGGTFEFEDLVVPTATLWPNNGSVHVAFNSHLYAKFSERVRGYDATPTAPYTNYMILTTANLKSWVKLEKNTGTISSPVWTPMTDAQYVVEFVNLERTHIRITPLDETAPGFNGVTASMKDETQYRMRIVDTGVGGEGDGYALQDLRGNPLTTTAWAAFITEDITPPTLAFTCGANQTPNKWNVTFTSNEDSTVVYWAWFDESATVTAENLFNMAYATSMKDTLVGVGTSTKTKTVTFPNPPGTDYDYYLYAVAADNEIDVYVPSAFGNAWVVSDPVFIASGDCNPASPYYAVGIRDIRPAPNKNTTVQSCWSNVCDDDVPVATLKQWHQSQIVPTNATFIIDFNENVVSEAVNQSDNMFADPEVYAKEIRLRKWENNVSLPITITVVGGDSVRITPVSPLDPETKYYIEIDRYAIRDTATCNGQPAYNYFPGWVGKTDWWFATNDEVRPQLVSVTPTGNCVEQGNNSISFTFKEGNVNGVKTKIQTNPFRNNIYIYKAASYPDGEPYEIIYAHGPGATPKVATKTGDSTYVLTYPTTHFYGSEECYVVQWDTTLFVDGSPNANVYIENASAVTGSTYPDTKWDQFGFCTRDYLKPVIHWAVVNTWWNGWDPTYVYPVYGTGGVLATGKLDPNDPSYVTGSQTVNINVCGDNLVPNKLAFYVWTDEQITHTVGHATKDLFQLRVAGTSNIVSLAVDSTNYSLSPASLGNKTMAGGTIVNNIWYSVSPSNLGDTLQGNTRYEFRVISEEVRDTNLYSCTENGNVGDVLFTLCTWNSDPAKATLTDACAQEINTLKIGNDSIKPWVPDTCVCEAPYFDLCFDKVLVKLGNEGAVPPITVPGSPWFTYANLIMNASDLMATNNGPYIDFRAKGGNAVVIDSVKTFLNGVDISTGQPCGCGTGALCYRLYVHPELAENTRYVLTVKDSVLVDQVRIPNGNLFPGQTWEFETRWDTNPYITWVSPVDGSTSVSPNQDLKIVFNRPVVRGEGYITVRDNGIPSGVVFSYPGTDAAHVLFNAIGDTLTIKHPAFSDNTHFYVEVFDNFVYGKDCDGMPFLGDIEQGLITDRWDFGTGDVDGPIASLYPNQNPEDYTAECVPPVTNLVMTFDENVYFENNCAEIVIYRAVSLTSGGAPEGSLAGGAVYGDVVERIPLVESNFPQVIVDGTNPANGLTDNRVTVIPRTVFVSGATYYVRVEGNGTSCDSEVEILKDIMGNTWHYPLTSPLPGVHYNDWWFKIADDSAPVLLTTSPARLEVLEASQLGEGVTTDIKLNFNMPVWAGQDTIRIWEFITNPQGGVGNQEEHLWAAFDVEQGVASGKITIEGSCVTIHDVMLLDGINWYFVTADPGTFTSTVPCIKKQWTGISNPDTWIFSTEADDTCPALADVIVDSDADDDTYEQPESVNFTITFTEDVSVLYGSQEAYILNEEGDVVAEATIQPSDITGNVLTLNIADFSAPLADQTAYMLNIPTHSITDKATNSTHNALWPVPGETGAYFGNVPAGNENFLCEEINVPFETGDFTAPEVVNYSPFVSCLDNEVIIAATFSEDVQDGDGYIRLVDADGVLDDILLDAANDEDDAANAVAFTVTLPDETNWYVLVDEGFVTDMVYMGSVDGPWNNVAIDDPAEWTFGIDDNTIPSLESWTVPGQDMNNLMTTFDVVLTYDDVITDADVFDLQLLMGTSPVAGIGSAELGPNDDQVTVHIANVPDRSEYSLVLNSGFVQDDACHANSSLADLVTGLKVGDRTKPTVVGTPTGILGSYIGVQIKADFFDHTDLTVLGPISIKNYTHSGTLISQVSWTPTLDANQAAVTSPALWFGYVEVKIPAGTVKDVNGNLNDEYTWVFYITDNIAPAENCLLSVTPADGASGVLSQPNLVMEFCERMSACATNKYVKVYELNSTGTNVEVAQILVTSAMINGTTVTIPLNAVTIRPDYNPARPGTLKDKQDYIVMADAGSICDEAGNPWAGISTPVRWNWTTGDNTAPTAWLQPASGTNQPNSIVVRVHFSEPVVGATAKTVITGIKEGTTPVWTVVDDSTYTVTVEALDLASVVITVPTTVTDVPDAKGYGNPLAAAVTGTFVVGDNTKPEVTASAPADPQERTFAVALNFTEPVKGVAAALTVTGGTYVLTGADGASTYTVTITAVDEAVVKVKLATTVTDMSVNANALKSGLDLTYNVGDHVAPTYTVTPVTLEDAKNTFNVQIKFSEEVVGVASGITVTGGTTTGAVLTSTPFTYNLPITAPDHATVTVNIASSITDGAPNYNHVVAGVYTYNVGDNTPPTMTVDAPADPQKTTFDVTLTFNEPVTGVNTAGVLRAVNGTITKIKGADGGTEYVVTITGPEQTNVILQVSTLVKDLAGNKFAGVNLSYHIGDFTAPTATAMSPTGVLPIDDTTFDLELTLNENVVAGTGTMIVFKGADAVATFTPAQVTISGNKVSVPVSLDKFTKYWVYVTPGFVKDASGNAFAGITLPTIWAFETKNFKVGVDPISSIQFEVYPNPFNDFIKIKNADKLNRVVISNIAGQRVIDVMNPDGEVRTPNLVSGVYIISLFSDDVIVKTERIVKR